MKKLVFLGFIGFVVLLSSGFGESSAVESHVDMEAAHLFCLKANNITTDDFEHMMKALKEYEVEMDAKSSEYEDENEDDNDNEEDESESDDESKNDSDADDMEKKLIDFSMKFKCYGLCLFEQYGVLGQDDKIDLELLQKFDEISDSSMEIVKDCKIMHDKEPNACEYSFKILACIGSGMFAREHN